MDEQEATAPAAAHSNDGISSAKEGMAITPTAPPASPAEAVTRQMQALQAISDVSLEHARLDDLLEALLQRIQRMFAVDNVAILLPTPDGRELTLYAVRGPEEAVNQMLPQDSQSPLDVSPIHR